MSFKDLRAIERRVERLADQREIDRAGRVASAEALTRVGRIQRIAHMIHRGHPEMCRIFGIAEEGRPRWV